MFLRSPVMKKKKQEEQLLSQKAPVEEKSNNINTTAFPLSDMKPSEELQIYYNDAYMREKQRFNDIFGIIEQPAEEKPQETPEPDLNDYVHIDEFKKLKKKLRGYCIAFWCVLAVAIAMIIIFLRVNVFSI